MLKPICQKNNKNPLTIEDKKLNQDISKERVVNENVIDFIKHFKIISDHYTSFETIILIFN